MKVIFGYVTYNGLSVTHQFSGDPIIAIYNPHHHTSNQDKSK
jgi:hypothetical protein